jgi:acyl carrier protein
MDNKSKYLAIFKETFNVKEISEDTKYNEIPEWDSIGHMTLMSALEEKFKISIDTDDIVDFSSVKVGYKILDKYGVKL